MRNILLSGLAVLLLVLTTPSSHGAFAFLAPCNTRPVGVGNRPVVSPAFLNAGRPKRILSAPHHKSSTELSLSLSGILKRKHRGAETNKLEDDGPLPIPTPSSSEERPSRRKRLKKRLQKIVKKSAAVVLAASFTLAPLKTASAFYSRGVEQQQQTMPAWWVRDDTLGEVPPVPIPYKRIRLINHMGPQRLHPKLDIFADFEQEFEKETAKKEAATGNDSIRTTATTEAAVVDVSGTEEEESKSVVVQKSDSPRAAMAGKTVLVAAGTAAGIAGGTRLFILKRKTQQEDLDDSSEEEEEKQRLRIQKEKEYVQNLLDEQEPNNGDVNVNGAKNTNKGTINGTPLSFPEQQGPNGDINGANTTAIESRTPPTPTPKEKPAISLQRSPKKTTPETKQDKDASRPSKKSPTPSSSRNKSSLTELQRNHQELQRNLEILDLTKKIRNRKTQREQAEQEEELARAQLETEGLTLKAQHEKARKTVATVEARWLETIEENKRKAQELLGGMERIQESRERRQKARQQERARRAEEERIRIAQQKLERQRQDQLELAKKGERTRRKLMEGRLYEENLRALDRKRVEREVTLEKEIQRQRQEQIETYGSVTPEPPIVRPPPVKAKRRQANVPFFATTKRESMALIMPKATAKKSTTRAREETTTKTQDSAPFYGLSEAQEMSVPEKFIAPDQDVERKETEEVILPSKAKEDARKRTQKAEVTLRALLDARLAIEARVKATIMETKKALQAKSSTSAELEQKSKAEARLQDVNTIGKEQQTEVNVLEAHLAMESKESTKASTTSSMKQKQNAELVSRALLQARISNEAVKTKIMVPERIVDAEPAEEVKDADTLEAKKKAERTARSLMEARFALGAREKAKAKLMVPEKTVDVERVEAKDANTLEAKKKAERTARSLMETRFAFKARDKVKTRPIVPEITVDADRVEAKDANTLEAKKKAERTARSLMETRFAFKAREKVKTRPIVPEIGIDADLVEAKDANTLEAKKKAERTARSLMETRFAFKAREKVKTRPIEEITVDAENKPSSIGENIVANALQSIDAKSVESKPAAATEEEALSEPTGEDVSSTKQPTDAKASVGTHPGLDSYYKSVRAMGNTRGSEN